jgi:hypothetical protein
MTDVTLQRPVGRFQAQLRPARLRASSPYLPLGPWTDERVAEVGERLQQQIYGSIPRLTPLRVTERRAVASDRLGAAAIVEHWQVELVDARGPMRFGLFLILPRAAAPRAIILAQLFRRPPFFVDRIEQALVADTSAQRRSRLGDAMLEIVLGRHIHAPPFEQVVQGGFGIALYCPGDIVPDHKERAPAILERLSASPNADERAGALAGWAALTSAVRRLLNEDERVGGAPIVAWGHSRHGKAALLAAAFDQGFAGVIAHQSGRFGASLTHGGSGEGPTQIARAYPHWFCARFHNETLHRWPHDVDQHQLLALIAPRPILLGNGRRDFWADPEGAFRAARAASEAFTTYGQPGLLQLESSRPNLEGGIAFFTRAGGHGVNGADWRYFLAFLEAKFAVRSSAPVAPASARLSVPATANARRRW